MSTVQTLSIHALLDPATVRVRQAAPDKATVLDDVIALLEGRPEVIDLAQVRRDVLMREAKMTTGVGMGLALPHAKTSAVSDTLAAFVITEAPVSFDAMDGEGVRLIFLLVGPEHERIRHIKLLSRISRLMNHAAFRNRLLRADSPGDVIDIFSEAEATL